MILRRGPLLPVLFISLALPRESRRDTPESLTLEDSTKSTSAADDIQPRHLTYTNSSIYILQGAKKHTAIFSQEDLDDVFRKGTDTDNFWSSLKVPSCAGRWVYVSPSGRDIYALRGYDSPKEEDCLKLSPYNATAWAFRFVAEDFHSYWELDSETDDEPCKDVAAFNGVGLRRYRSKVSYPVLAPTRDAVHAGVSFTCDSNALHCLKGGTKVSSDMALLHGTLFNGKSQWVARSTKPQGWFQRQFVDCANEETKRELASLLQLATSDRRKTHWKAKYVDISTKDFVWRY